MKFKILSINQNEWNKLGVNVELSKTISVGDVYENREHNFQRFICNREGVKKIFFFGGDFNFDGLVKLGLIEVIDHLNYE